MLARAAHLESTAMALVGLAALLGALFSVFLRFQGGRGVATSLGVWLALAPVPILIALGVFLVVFAVRRIMSLSSLGAAVTLPVVVAALSYPRDYLILAIAMSAIVIWRHRANIGRLLRGEEPTFKLGGSRTEEHQQ